MRRPSDLIFACLLRSTTALALDSSTNKIETALALGNSGYIALRRANRADVPSISRVNLATLPENYHHQFFINHMKQWPELAIVAEHVTSADDEVSNGSGWKIRNPFSGYDPSQPNRNGGKIVAYVLGKIGDSNNGDEVSDDDERLGHVTSLAVSKEYRRHHIASELMNELHHSLSQRYDASHVGLHVRMSNKGATRLYCDTMGYQVVDIIKGYYQDGEDAFLMKRKLSDCDILQ